MILNYIFIYIYHNKACIWSNILNLNETKNTCSILIIVFGWVAQSGKQVIYSMLNGRWGKLGYYFGE